MVAVAPASRASCCGPICGQPPAIAASRFAPPCYCDDTPKEKAGAPLRDAPEGWFFRRMSPLRATIDPITKQMAVPRRF